MLQAFFLSAINEDRRNVLHIVCKLGKRNLLEFLIEKAGSDHLNILKFVINAQDEMKLTPFYYLCQKGYIKKFSFEHQKTK